MGVARLWLRLVLKRDAVVGARACRGRTALILAAAMIGGALAALVVPSPAVAQTLKAPLSGLVSMGPTTLGPGGVPINDLSPILAEPGVFNGVVINIGWDALQPTPTTLDTSTIDQALAAVAAYNAKYPKTPLGVRLNVEASLLAPGWVKTMDGPAVVTLDQPNGNAPPTIFTIGRFWNADYQLAWDDTASQAGREIRYQPADQRDLEHGLLLRDRRALRPDHQQPGDRQYACGRVHRRQVSRLPGEVAQLLPWLEGDADALGV